MIRKPIKLVSLSYFLLQLIMNLVPIPKVDSTLISKPYKIQICFTKAKPRPVPPSSFDLDLSTL